MGARVSVPEDRASDTDIALCPAKHLKIEAEPAVERHRVEVSGPVMYIVALEIRCVKPRFPAERSVEAEISAETVIVLYARTSMRREAFVIDPYLFIPFPRPFGERVVDCIYISDKDSAAAGYMGEFPVYA